MTLNQVAQVTIPGAPDLSNYYTQSEADAKFALKGEGGSVDTSKFLTKTDAASTYLTQTSASNTYLSKTTAANTYLTESDADSMYAAKGDVYTRDQVDSMIPDNSGSVSLSYRATNLRASSLSNATSLGGLTAPEAGTYLVFWYLRAGGLPGGGQTAAYVEVDTTSNTFMSACAVVVGNNGTYDGSAQMTSGYTSMVLGAGYSVSFTWMTNTAGGSISDGRACMVKIA